MSKGNLLDLYQGARNSRLREREGYGNSSNDSVQVGAHCFYVTLRLVGDLHLVRVSWRKDCVKG